jgi:hypothetical protein
MGKRKVFIGEVKGRAVEPVLKTGRKRPEAARGRGINRNTRVLLHKELIYEKV